MHARLKAAMALTTLTLAAGAGVGLQLILPPASPIVEALETLIPFGVVYLAVVAALGLGLPRARRSAA